MLLYSVCFGFFVSLFHFSVHQRLCIFIILGHKIKEIQIIDISAKMFHFYVTFSFWYQSRRTSDILNSATHNLLGLFLSGRELMFAPFLVFTFYNGNTNQEHQQAKLMGVTPGLRSCIIMKCFLLEILGNAFCTNFIVFMILELLYTLFLRLTENMYYRKHVGQQHNYIK